MAKREPEGPESSRELMEDVLEEKNLRYALKRVRANRGGAGVDGMSVEQLPLYLKEHWPAIRKQLLESTYRLQPVRG